MSQLLLAVIAVLFIQAVLLLVLSIGLVGIYIYLCQLIRAGLEARGLVSSPRTAQMQRVQKEYLKRMHARQGKEQPPNKKNEPVSKEERSLDLEVADEYDAYVGSALGERE